MNADEIVRALRSYASDCDDDEACCQCTFAWVCDKFDNNAPKIIADLIDSLTAQLASVTAERDALKEALSDMRFAYLNKDNPPHQFEIDALEKANDLLGPIGKEQNDG